MNTNLQDEMLMHFLTLYFVNVCAVDFGCVDDKIKIDEGQNAENYLVRRFERFCILAESKDKTHMTPRAAALVSDHFEACGYKKYDIKAISDDVVFPTLKEKGKLYIVINKRNINTYIHLFAYEVAKLKLENAAIDRADDQVVEIEADLKRCIMSSVLDVNVARTDYNLTDTSNSTGQKNHFVRFGSEPGSAGRAEHVDSSGYVGSYKHVESYGKQ